MRQRIMWAALVGLTTTLVGCAYGLKPMDDDDDQGTGWGAVLGHNDGTLQGGTAGSCYADLGECNPLTSSCGLGEACDLGSAYEFQCFAPPNDASVGDSCDATYGPFCSHGSMCLDGVCRAFCCDASDCGTWSCQSYSTGSSLAVHLCVPY